MTDREYLALLDSEPEPCGHYPSQHSSREEAIPCSRGFDRPASPRGTWPADDMPDPSGRLDVI